VPVSPTTSGDEIIVIAQNIFLSVGENLKVSINEDSTASNSYTENRSEIGIMLKHKTYSFPTGKT